MVTLNKREAKPRVKKGENHVLWPLIFCVAVRAVVYVFANHHRNFFEGDSVRYMGYMIELLGRGTIDDGNWNAPGYFLFEALNYQVLHWGHYGLLAFQNLFDLILAFCLMREVRESKLACWAIALFCTCDLASVLYANAMMTESLSAFFLSLGVLLAIKRNRLFWGSFFFGLSCVVRGGNWPLYLIFLALLLVSRLNKLSLKVAAQGLMALILGALLTVGPVVTYNGLKFSHWNLSSQGEYHAVTIGAGIIMRQKNVSWAEGEKEFNIYHDDLITSGVIAPHLPVQKSRAQALMRFISENKKAFIWSVARGFATQFIGGQNAELMHRLAGREIESDPLPPLVHRTLIGIHALWMTFVWCVFATAAMFLWRRRRERALITFTVMALAYFFVTVATLGSARFRIPCMGSVALCIGLAAVQREREEVTVAHPS